MATLFRVKVRYVARKEIIQPDDHNKCVDALKEIVRVSYDLLEKMGQPVF